MDRDYEIRPWVSETRLRDKPLGQEAEIDRDYGMGLWVSETHLRTHDCYRILGEVKKGQKV